MIAPIEDNNSNFDLVELADDGSIGRLTPHCREHRAMIKVSPVYWRCPQAVNLNTGKAYKECRAGCREV